MSLKLILLSHSETAAKLCREIPETENPSLSLFSVSPLSLPPPRRRRVVVVVVAADWWWWSDLVSLSCFLVPDPYPDLG